MKTTPLLTLLITLMLFITSCVEDGTVEPKEDLSDAKIESVTIINVPPYYWDNGSSPDLYLTLTSTSDPSLTYTSNTVDNVEEVPQILNFQQDIPITDELWELVLLDHDDLNADDVIYVIAFNPYSDASAGKIPVYNDGILLMEFNYN